MVEHTMGNFYWMSSSITWEAAHISDNDDNDETDNYDSYYENGRIHSKATYIFTQMSKAKKWLNNEL